MLGILLALWGSRALLLLMAPPLLAATLNVRPDTIVLAFALGLSVLAGLLLWTGYGIHCVFLEYRPGMGESPILITLAL